MATVRETLDKLESELVARIQGLRAELVPLEGELADVRRAKTALAKTEAKAETKPEEASQLPAWARADDPPPPSKQPAYIFLTMKELTLKALREQFPNGATANQLLEHFYNAWGRLDVRRSSLSPQLSRLRAEEKIGLRPGNIWVLLPEKNEAPTEGQSEGASNMDEGGSSSSDGRSGRWLLLD